MQLIKRLSGKLITAIVIAALVAAFTVCSVSFAIGTAKADTVKDTVEYEPTSLGISNPHFTDTSGSYPASPSNWTGGYVGSGSGAVISGVVDLSAAAYNSGDDDKKGNEKYELDQYDEYKGNEIPRTIFGTKDHDGSDTKTLLVNTSEGAQTAYAYTSSEMTFAPDSFYRVSAWVKTGDFASSGATIKLNGLGENCSFININTVSDCKVDGKLSFTSENNYGWKQYYFYVRTGASISHTVTLSLGIGDAFTGSDEDSIAIPSYASGYAFFDTVAAERISAETFGFITSDFVKATDRDNVYYDNLGRSMVIDLSDTDYIKDTDNSEIGSFSSDLKGWTTNVRYSDSDDEDEDIEYGGAANAFIFGDEQVDIDTDELGNVKNDYGMTKNPWTPFGLAEKQFTGTGYDPFVGTNHNILVLSTRNNGKFDTSCIGVASPDVTIERYKYYRFGVWVKGDGISGGNGISIGVKGQSNNTGNNNKLHQWYTNLDGDSSDTAHYGWKEQVVYIRGSQLSDLTVHFELWLGSPTQKSSGIAYFDNVTFTELSYSEYSAMSGADGGNSLTLDAVSADTGITNGNFMSIGDSDEDFAYPLPAAEWTLIDAATSEANGFSDNAVDTDGAIRGILPVDDETFEQIRGEYKNLAHIKNPGMIGNGPLYNALVISSTKKTAVGYRSATFAAASGSGYKINVEMAVDSVTDGYGAALVLKSENDVIATIEGIKDTNNAYRTYTFYIDAPVSDQNLSVEVWLGLGDRKNNTLKLSDGNVYVKSVGLETWTVDENTTVAQEYAKLAETYFASMSNPESLKALNYAMYSFNAPNLDYYDAYTYNAFGGYGVPYQWSVSSATGNTESGIFDSSNLAGNAVYEGFDKKDQTGNMLFIYNTMPNKTTYTYGNSISLAASTYYRLDVTLKVNLPEEELKNETKIGATVKLTGTKEDAFENIKNTSTVVMKPNGNNPGYTDTETFKTFTFYIASGTNGGSVGLSISLGGDDMFSRIQGRLVVSDISLTSINNVTFEEMEKKLAEAEEDDELLIYNKAIKLSETSTDGDTDDGDNTEDTDTDDNAGGDIAWWLIPTVVFSACVLVAIIIIVAFRIKDVVKRKKKKTYKTDYDRNDVIKKLDELSADVNAEPDETKTEETLDDYDEVVTDELDETDTASEPTETETEQSSDTTETTDDQTVEEVKENKDDKAPDEQVKAPEKENVETDLDD